MARDRRVLCGVPLVTDLMLGTFLGVAELGAGGRAQLDLIRCSQCLPPPGKF